VPSTTWLTRLFRADPLHRTSFPVFPTCASSLCFTSSRISHFMEVIASANQLLSEHAALTSRVRAAQRANRRRLRALPSPPYGILQLPLIPSPPHSPTPSPPESPVLSAKTRPERPELPPAKRARAARYDNYVPEEETIRNDYSQRYVDGGEWPQNWVLGAEPENRFDELRAFMK
jgi:mRNA m6A methyltransferase non-catalytic subunit